MSERNAITAAARAIVAMDGGSFARKSEADQKDWDTARSLLWGILKRNGYELSAPGSARVKQAKKPKEEREKDPTCYFKCDHCSYVTTAPTSDVKAVGHQMCPECDRETSEITKAEYDAIDYTHGVNDGEGAIPLPSGQYLVFESADENPKGASYVRIIDGKGQELAYWSYTEWCESEDQAQEVIGAILGACQHGASRR